MNQKFAKGTGRVGKKTETNRKPSGSAPSRSDAAKHLAAAESQTAGRVQTRTLPSAGPKEKLNVFKKKSPKAVRDDQAPTLPVSAFHLFCKDIKRLSEDEKKSVFGDDFAALSKLEQVRRISARWKELPDEDALKQKCLEIFRQSLEKYRKEKAVYDDRVNAFQQDGDSNTVYVGNLGPNVDEAVLKAHFEDVAA
ncbi:hypothetical protein HDU91_001236, partial [Kappamyces sp. JEL0680]